MFLPTLLTFWFYQRSLPKTILKGVSPISIGFKCKIKRNKIKNNLDSTKTTLKKIEEIAKNLTMCNLLYFVAQTVAAMSRQLFFFSRIVEVTTHKLKKRYCLRTVDQNKVRPFTRTIYNQLINALTKFAAIQNQVMLSRPAINETKTSKMDI